MGIYSGAHICQCLSRLSVARRHCTVTISGDRKKTGKQFSEGVLGLARGLSELGLKVGDVVAISALNSDIYLEWLLAVSFVGGIPAPLNHRWSLEEAKLAMDDVRPILLVTDMSSSSNNNYWHTKFQVDFVHSLRWHVFMTAPPLKKTQTISTTAAATKTSSSSSSASSVILTTEMLKKPTLNKYQGAYHWAPEGAAIICFTSGTTGRPKGVTLSHSSLIVQSLAKIAVVGYDENDIYLHTASLCHIGGISSSMTMLMLGSCHVIMPKFEAKSAVEAVQKHHVTCFITVPAIMADLISMIRSNETFKKLETVRRILNGGGGLSAELTEDAIKYFPRAKLVSAYGMTEACSSLTFKTIYDPAAASISSSRNSELPFLHEIGGSLWYNVVHQTGGICVGKPPPHVELRIYNVDNDENENDDTCGVGNILTRGPHVMLGYYYNPATTTATTNTTNSRVSCCGFWLDTGDIGRIADDGNLWLLGRTNGRIKSGGENIYPEEVEAVLSQHPGISFAVVLGLPDARLAEKVVACIQIKENWKWFHYSTSNNSNAAAADDASSLSTHSLQKFCREHNLTGFKVPKIIIIWRKPFPLTPNGKVKRDLVKNQVISHMRLLDGTSSSCL